MGDAIRKPVPGMRKNIMASTFDRVKRFMEELKEPMFPSEIARKLRVDYNSFILATQMLKTRTDGEGRIMLDKKEE